MLWLRNKKTKLCLPYTLSRCQILSCIGGLNKRVLGPWFAHLSPGSFGPVVKEVPFKIFLFLALVASFFSREEWFVQFGRGQYEEHFCEIILTLGQ